MPPRGNAPNGGGELNALLVFYLLSLQRAQESNANYLSNRVSSLSDPLQCLLNMDNSINMNNNTKSNGHHLPSSNNKCNPQSHCKAYWDPSRVDNRDIVSNRLLGMPILHWIRTSCNSY